MTDHWQTMEDALTERHERLMSTLSRWPEGSVIHERRLAEANELYAALAFVREQRQGQLYSHRDGESVAPEVAGWYWVRVERLEDFSTKVCLEVWRRGFGRWLEFGDVNELGAIGGILSIYGPITPPWEGKEVDGDK